jgi:hypothetical protein
MGLIISIPIGIIYNLIIGKFANMFTSNLEYNDKIQKKVIIELLGGIVALVIAFMVFGSNMFENKIVKYGLILGGLILLFYSSICSWDVMNDVTKLLMLFLLMLFCMLCSYKYLYYNKNDKNDKKIKNVE